MNLNGVDIDSLRLINGECLIEIHSLTEDEIEFNGGKLKLVHNLKSETGDFNPSELMSLVSSIKKSNYKDKEAMKKYKMLQAQQMQQSDDKKIDHRMGQAVRRGVIVKLPEKDNQNGAWDFDCEFDGKEGDEVWFDSMATREKIENGEGAIVIGEKTYVLVSTRCVFAVKKGDDVEGLNGYIIGRELPNEIKIGSIHVPGTSVARVEVVTPPKRNPTYRSQELWNNSEVKKGDVVCMKKHFAIKLDSTMAESTDLVRFQSRVIMAFEE
jgi:co-chaperonin GroES (HSP10)